VTNRDLCQEVKAGRFRADLYHRLSVYPIQVPALRDRPGDVALLAGHFLDEARARLGLKSVRLTKAARSALERYGWPGNVRELEHVILRAALRASAGRLLDTAVVDAEHLALDDSPKIRAANTPVTAAQARAGASLSEATDQFQRELLVKALKETKGNWAEAARRLKMDRGNLHRLGQRLGLK
jgi:anaerobic nitric oxide reductase transcription regulator